ncbi:MAG: ABC transporter permease, partial [Oscillospiraceae bacterium]|nr:ABC transporter permease [Oscillospiraceae bacterium]
MNGIQMVLSIFLYRFKTLFGRKANAFTLLALPCVILSCLWLFGRFYATDPVRIPVGVVDNDNSEFSKLVIARIKQDSSALELRECSISEAEVLVKNGALEAAVVFNKGFMEDLIALYPEGVTEFIYSPFSLARYLVQELFTSQISRLRFNCDAANRAVELRRMEAAATAVAEAGADAGASAGARSGAEAGADAGASAGARSGAEAGADAGANAGARSGAEAGVDAGANAGARSGAEAGGGAGAGANAEAEEANTRAGEANARA